MSACFFGKRSHNLICRLSYMNFPRDGVRAGRAVAKNSRMASAWHQLFGLMQHLIMSVTSDLQDAYAWSEGSDDSRNGESSNHGEVRRVLQLV